MVLEKVNISLGRNTNLMATSLTIKKTFTDTARGILTKMKLPLCFDSTNTKKQNYQKDNGTDNRDGRSDTLEDLMRMNN